MKRMLMFGLTLVMMASLLAACGGGNNSQNAPSNQADGKQKKVSIALWTLSGSGWEWVVEAVEQFQSENPDIEVVHSAYAVDPLKENLKVAASSKTMPDIWFTWGGSLGSFYPENGLALDLSKIAEEHNYAEIYNKAALDMSTFNGKLYGIPMRLNALSMWYTKEAYEATNLQPPATFAEFEEQLEILKNAGYIPLAFGSKGGWHTMRLAELLIEHYGGPELHDQLLSLSASWDNEAVIQTFAKLKEYTDKEYFPKGYVSLDPEEAQNLMYQKKAAIINEGTWFDSSIITSGFDVNDFGVFKFPTEQSPVRPSVFAEMLQISADASPEKQAAAIKLGEYLTSVKVINQFVDVYGSPATLNVNTSEANPHMKEILDSASDGAFQIMDQALPQQLIQKWFEAQDRVALGDWTPQQAAQEMDKAVQEYVSKNSQ